MQRYLFHFGLAVSLVTAGLIIVAWCVAGSVDPSKHFVSITRNFHISIRARGADARLQIFNDSSYGPYQGSIVGVGSGPASPQMTRFGDVAGIYFRHIRWPDGGTLWTLSLSLAYPLIASLVLPCIWLLGEIRRSRRCFPVLEQSASQGEAL